jgi:hypothetical protein
MFIVDKRTEKKRIKEVMKTVANLTGDPINWIYFVQECIEELLDDMSWIKEK